MKYSLLFLGFATLLLAGCNTSPLTSPQKQTIPTAASSSMMSISTSSASIIDPLSLHASDHLGPLTVKANTASGEADNLFGAIEFSGTVTLKGTYTDVGSGGDGSPQVICMSNWQSPQTGQFPVIDSPRNYHMLRMAKTSENDARICFDRKEAIKKGFTAQTSGNATVVIDSYTIRFNDTEGASQYGHLVKVTLDQ